MRNKRDELCLGIVGSLDCFKQAGVLNGDGRVISQANHKLQCVLIQEVLPIGLERNHANDLIFTSDGHGQLGNHVGHKLDIVRVILYILNQTGLSRCSNSTNDSAMQWPQFLFVSG